MEYASLGKVVFKIPDYRQHSEISKYEQVDINTIFAPSQKQYFGAENREIRISVLWHIDFCNPLKELENLKKQASTGEPYKLIIGKIPIGNFVIKEINSDTQKIDANGNPIIIKADITLSEFVEKGLKTRKLKTKKGKAVKSTTSNNYIDKKQFIDTYNKDK